MSGNGTPNLSSEHRNGHDRDRDRDRDRDCDRDRTDGVSVSGDRIGNGKANSLSIWVPPGAVAVDQQNQNQEFHRLQPHPKQQYRSLIDGNTSGEDSDYGLLHEAEPAKIIRVGKDFQAKIPSLLSYEERMANFQDPEPDNALLVWSPPPPSPAHTDEILRKYLAIAVTEHHYTHDQALGLLFWHRYNVSRALWDLPKFTQDPLEWTPEDKRLFDHAFKLYGKSFDQVQSVLEDKSIRSIIKYYYDWKRNHLPRKASASLPSTVTDADIPVQANAMSPSQANGNSGSGSEKNATAETSSSMSRLHSNPMYAQFRNLSVRNVNNSPPLSPLLLPHRRLHQQQQRNQPQRLLQQRQHNSQPSSNHYVPLEQATSSASASTSGSSTGQSYHANEKANNANSPDFDGDLDVIVIE